MEIGCHEWVDELYQNWRSLVVVRSKTPLNVSGVLKELVNQSINDTLAAAEGPSNEDFHVEEAAGQDGPAEAAGSPSNGEGGFKIKCRCGVICEFVQIR